MTDEGITSSRQPQSSTAAWKEIVARYQQPAVWRGVWQVVNTLIPYVGLWCLMYFSVRISYWLAGPLSVVAGGFLVRIFIIFHDCGHGSFFKSRLANDIVGTFAGVLV